MTEIPVVDKFIEQLPMSPDQGVDPTAGLQVDIDKLILVLGITFGFILLLLLSILCIFYTMGVLQNVFGYYWGPPMGPIMTIPYYYPSESDNQLLSNDPNIRMDVHGGQFNHQMVINNAGASIHDLSLHQQQQFQQQQFQPQYGQMNGFLPQGQHYANNVHHSSIIYPDIDDLEDDVPIDIRRSNPQFIQDEEKNEIELEC